MTESDDIDQIPSSSRPNGLEIDDLYSENTMTTEPCESKNKVAFIIDIKEITLDCTKLIEEYKREIPFN